MFAFRCVDPDSRLRFPAVPQTSGANESNEKRMRLRYAGTCRVCAAALPAKTEAIYERETKTVRCVTHGDVDLPIPV